MSSGPNYAILKSKMAAIDICKKMISIMVDMRIKLKLLASILHY